MIFFQEDGHKYFDDQLGGPPRELVSVTRVLQDAGLVDTWYFKPIHAHRGKMVHRACIMEAQQVLDPQSLDPQIAGYVMAWRRFLSDLNATLLELEYITADLGLGYAGRVDCRLSIPGRELPVLVDIKSGSKADWHRTQVGAYVRTGAGLEHQDCAILYLRESGRYSLDLLDYWQKQRAVREFESLMQDRQEAPLFFAEAQG